MYKKLINFEKDENGCFICISHYKDKDGYAIFKKDGKAMKIHRHIYEECFGEIPKGMIVRHKCDNPSCINPEHLEIGTHQDNSNDKVSRGRHKGGKGETHGMAKLTKELVEEIRNKYIPYKVMQKDLAIEYGVSKRTIQAIVRKEIWK